uniref:Lymphocyte antigen 86 n=1 Tax=Sinocyclocheilus rhinocerous TaxID=307959 RepID=A0A673H0Z7_9TELE
MKTRLCDNMLLVLILIMVQMNQVHSQDPQWPVHTVLELLSFFHFIVSDPLQDVGFTLLPCPERLTDLIKIRLSIDELYSSYELWLNGHTILKRDEPLCLPHFPRFKFCGSRRGGERYFHTEVLQI